jgi:hypothetical protein
MAWAKLDDRLDTHPKFLRAWRQEPASVGLWTLGLTWASRHGTRGVVAREMVDLWAPPLEAIDALVDAGLWEPTEGGWTIHDYLDYNDHDAIREARREAGRKGGKASAESRRAQVEPKQ